MTSDWSSALAATNQNLVTFEYLLEHLKKHDKETGKDLDKDDKEQGSKEDIVTLLRDICGSVNDLRSEMDVKTVDSKTQADLVEQTNLRDKCSKLEFEVNSKLCSLSNLSYLSNHLSKQS